MATTYTVNITMDQNTVNQLYNNGYSLYAFKAVGSSNPSAQPTVWVQTKVFSLNTTVTWQEQYGAYTSLQTTLADKTQIVASASYPINLNNTLQVTSPTGTGSVVTTGIASAIEIQNMTDTQFTCGISQTSSSGQNILCAIPLFGNNIDVIQPIEQVLLTFATQAVNTGTVIYQAFAPALLIDMTGAPSGTRTVSYDINTNWKANTQSWAASYPASTQLAPLLIKTGSSLAQAAEGSLLLAGAAQEALMATDTAINIPEGHYVNVRVTPVTVASGSLSGGTGTMSSFGMFSCGTFANDDLPEIDGRYTISATNSDTGMLYQFGAGCVHSGPTSDFK